MLYVGGVKTVTATFRNAAGVATDPTTVTLRLLKPDGTVSEVVPTSDGSGVCHYDIPIDQAGVWRYGWVGTGTVATAKPDEFYVERAPVLTLPVTV